MNLMVTSVKRKILVLCHSNRSLGALEVIRFVAQEAAYSTNTIYHFGVFQGMKIDNLVPIAYEVNLQSFFQRLMFERFELPKIIQREQYDQVLSLQNFVLKNYKIPTGLLVHQGLMLMSYPYPSYEIKLRLKVFVQKLLFRFFKQDVNDFYVQLPWMKEQLILKYGIHPNIIHVVRTHEVQTVHQTKTVFGERLNLIYPASGFHYKNHTMVVDALTLLNKNLYSSINVTFTLNQNDNKYTRLLNKTVNTKQLPIELIGSITHDKLLKRYYTDILLFPSLVESQGFPLIEAMHSGTLIVCIDLPYARDSLVNYENVLYFESARHLTDIFITLIERKYVKKNENKTQSIEFPSLISHFEEVQQ